MSIAATNKLFRRVAATAAAFWLLTAVSAHAQETPAPAGLVVDTQTVSGNVRQKEATILGETGIRSGDKVTISDVQRAMRRVWATGQFKNIEPQLIESNVPGHISLKWVVEEQPFISKIEFRGLEKLRTGAVMDSVKLKVGTPYSPGKATLAQSIVRDMLAKKGFQLKKISHRLEPIPASKTGDYNLIFDVEEGQRVAVSEVVFEGNSVFDDDKLKSAMTTQPEGFFWFKSGTYDELKVRTDVREKLPAFYGASGYLDFAVLGDSLQVDAESGKARLIITVAEGPQYRLNDFNVEGNRRFPTEELKRYFDEESGGLLKGFGLGTTRAAQEKGQPFDQVSFETATGRVKQLYSNNGYLYAQVTPRIARDSGNVVNVTWDINEGNPAYISNVTILGNTFTHEDVVRGQLLTIPGDVYNEELLIQSYQRISSLGFFETPLTPPKMEPNEKGDVDITFEVKEKQTGSVNFGTAVGGGSGLAGFLGYDQPNLFGQAKSGHLRWEFGRYSNNFEASYSDPAIKGSRYSGSLSLFSARDRFITFSEGRRRRTGASVRVGVPMPNDLRTRLTVGYSISRTVYERFEEEESSSLFSLPPGVQSTVTVGLQRFNLDHPMFPTSGSRQELEADFNGGILGGSGNFQKYLASGAWYVPVGKIGGSAPGSRPIRFVLGLSAEAGLLFGDATRFPFERFYMGGVQFGKSLRGYEETTVTPLGFIRRCNAGETGCPPLDVRFGNSYLRMSADYNIRFNDNLSIGAFYDAGGVWRSPSEFNPSRLLRGAGVGVTLVTPFGPLGLDYAYGFDKTKPSWQLHFKFGQGF
ncbi:MAG TPA: outer membrane protein assembly factor BamA [Longimicrobiales bacterium]|nr:outer membrane protein assembly factor BamA [Longimicrobiales bacterium]